MEFQERLNDICKTFEKWFSQVIDSILDLKRQNKKCSNEE